VQVFCRGFRGWLYHTIPCFFFLVLKVKSCSIYFYIYNMKINKDRVLADRIAAEGRACVVILNKWDAVQEKDDKTYLKSIE
jgi:predicted GTPase